MSGETVEIIEQVQSVEVYEAAANVVLVQSETLLGPEGPRGLQGVQGDTGPQGSAATVAVGTVSTGAPGSDAEVTNSGTSGAAVLDFVLPRGATGSQGLQGVQGIQGAQGDPGSDGAAATIAVGTVSTGAPGSDAEVTNSGTPGAAVLDFVIPRGATGSQGLQGVQGIQGAQGDPGSDGAAATIAVGTVSTGDPGTDAEVTNSGTANAAVFDFSIPRGATGATGPQGPQGDPGADAIVYTGTLEVDFGATPSKEASGEVTGQTAILAESIPHAWLAARATSNNTVDDHKFGAIALHVVCGTPTAGVGFAIYVYCSIGYATGKFNLDWNWS